MDLESVVYITYTLSLVICIVGSIYLYRDNAQDLGVLVFVLGFVPLINVSLVLGYLVTHLVYSFLKWANKLIDKFYRE